MAEDIPALIDLSVLDEFPPDVQSFIKAFFSEHFVKMFIEKQALSAQKEMVQLRRGDASIEEFALMSRDRQLLWRFWQDLSNFSADCKLETTANMGE